MHVAVLGAGVIGTTTAWYLREAGYDVTVVERRGGPGEETSFANGGQISVSHAEPWASPGAPGQLLRWLFRSDAPLRFRPRLDPHQWAWALRFLSECRSRRYARNLETVVRLGLYSRQCLSDLRERTGIEYHQRREGILHFYTDPDVYAAAHGPAARMRALGCERDVIDVADAVAREPALGTLQPELRGATWTPGDESGDAHIFTRQLAGLAGAAGVRFLFNSRVMGLETEAGAVRRVRLNQAGAFTHLEADAVVVALGSFSAPLLRPQGINLPVYPARGYSVTVPVRDPEQAYTVSLIDDEYKLVYSRLGDELRVAGMAEIDGWRQDIDPARCRQILDRLAHCFPKAGHWDQARFWAGLRPATPSSVPFVGATPWPGLYLNTGHGTLGWTNACGSAALLSERIAGEMGPLDLDYHGR
jgi:D-amino-acid dehydrogenase